MYLDISIVPQTETNKALKYVGFYKEQPGPSKVRRVLIWSKTYTSLKKIMYCTLMLIMYCTLMLIH